ncbi:MAG: glycoside hydrolase family protein [Rikenellaceae bacterium]
MKKIALLLAVSLVNVTIAQDVERELPAEWRGIVEGGRFQDRFLPLVDGKLSSDVWGAKEVIPRYVDNGIEDDVISYWGGNIIEDGGKYHLYVCGWLENSAKGHMAWMKSAIFHTVADNIYGPYTTMDIVNLGHNPEIYRAKNGSYVLSAHMQWKPYIAVSKKIEGPWNYQPLECNMRDRTLIEGLSNLSFASREDGSVVMVCRGGGIWISRDGISDFEQVTTESVYPKREGRFEDPVIWRDNVQYHLIVNDWLGRIAYYLRSKDGVKWVEDVGEAYTPGIARHKSGHVEDWYKFERIKVFQDKERRAVLANFAVCDTIKKQDLSNDNHSSKNIIIPLNKGLLIDICNETIQPKMKSISVKIKAEEGFNPAKQLDVSSLRFGLNADINFGRGCKVKSTEVSGDDLIVTFDTKGYTIPDSEFAPKLLGRDRDGAMVYGYARNPNVDFQPAMLSAVKPVQEGDKIVVEVTNYGFKSSEVATMKLTLPDGRSYEAQVDPIDSYQSRKVTFGIAKLPPSGEATIEIRSKSNSTVGYTEKIEIDKPKPGKKG